MVLIIKSVPDKRYVMADRELPISFLLGDFKGKELVTLGELSEFETEKVANEWGLVAKNYEIDQKGIPKYLAGYITLEEKQLKRILESKKEKHLEEIRYRTQKVNEINNIGRILESSTL